MTFTFETHSFVHPPHGLVNLANRYATQNRDDPACLTLIFTHGTSFHKEQFEPTIHKLLQLDAEGPNIIREAWSLDLFNHGQAALQNRRVIKEHGILCCTDSQTEMTRNFYTLPRFRGHRLIAVAHSGSCTYWVNSGRHYNKLPIDGMIMVDPTLMFPGMTPDDWRVKRGITNTRGVLARNDNWKDFATLRAFMTRRSPWKKWDPRVLEIYLKYAFTEAVDEEGKPCVSPTLRKEEEAVLYPSEAHTVDPADVAKIARQLPLHYIWADFPEFVQDNAKADICAAAENKLVSVRKVPGAGHLIPQEKPDDLALAISSILPSFAATPLKASL